ncbi:MAG TPA: hypothetical protein VKW06_06355 [Candidatus Angelobacter sp.]|nr:hypothetical protein [Candidatus Angelobacter sp.]
MHFSEDDLAAALRRKDPGPDFAQRVIKAVGEDRQQSPRAALGRKFTPGWWPFRFSPVLGGALAAVLVFACWFGVAWYRARQVEIARGEKARQEAILALRITSAKLHHVFRHVNQQEAPQPKIRRQSL